MRRCACSGAVCADTPARRAMVLGRPVPRISTADQRRAPVAWWSRHARGRGRTRSPRSCDARCCVSGALASLYVRSPTSPRQSSRPALPGSAIAIGRLRPPILVVYRSVYIHNVMRSTLRPHMASMTGRGDGVVHCELALDQYATRLPCRSAAPHPPHMHTSCDPSPVCVESGNATHVVSIIALHVV